MAKTLFYFSSQHIVSKLFWNIYVTRTALLFAIRQLQFHKHLIVNVDVGSLSWKISWSCRWINNEAFIRYSYFSINYRAGLVFLNLYWHLEKDQGFSIKQCIYMSKSSAKFFTVRENRVRFFNLTHQFFITVNVL